MVVFALLALVQPTSGLTEDPKQDLVTQFLAKEKAVGVAVAVVDGSKTWQFEAGFSDRDQNKEVIPATLFRLGSVSKPVGATLAMSLVQEGKLDLDKGVSAYVAGFPDANGTITLRRILSHTSGIRHYSKDKNDTFYEPKTTPEALAVFKDDPLLFKPGEKYSYSTHAYTVVVAAVESASKMSYREYLQTYISRRSAPSLDCEAIKDSKPERTELFTKEGKQYGKRQDISWKIGGGGLESSAIDVAKFGVAVADGSLLHPKTLKSMWTKQKLNDGKLIGAGLGWDLSKKGFARHAGGQQGCSAYLLVDQKKKIAVAVMCNTDGMPVGKLAQDLYQAYVK